MADLSKKAMLVRLSISQWTARKYDRRASEKVARDYGADPDAGRYNKVLVARDAIKRIQRAANEARGYHYENTLPWLDDGARILPAANFTEYSARMRELKTRFEEAVAGFCEAYPALVDEARTNLNGLFDPADYPDTSEIRGRYGMEVSIDPLPEAGDFRVRLQARDVNRIQEEIARRARAAQARAMRDLWERLYGCVARMAERLGDRDAVFRDSLVENARELCALLPRLNLADDPRLEELRREVEGRLCRHEPQELRDRPGVRSRTARAAQDIMAVMEGYMMEGGEG